MKSVVKDGCYNPNQTEMEHPKKAPAFQDGEREPSWNHLLYKSCWQQSLKEVGGARPSGRTWKQEHRQERDNTDTGLRPRVATIDWSDTNCNLIYPINWNISQMHDSQRMYLNYFGETLWFFMFPILCLMTASLPSLSALVCIQC